MHTTTPTIMSMEQNKNCVDEDNDGDVLKQETQDLAGLLSSPEAKPRPQQQTQHEINSNGVKSEMTPDVKEEIKEENSVKQEPGNPGSVGKLPNGDANLDLDKKVGTPGDIKSQEKAKQEPNGNPNTPLMGDSQQQQQQGNMGQIHRGNMGMGMSPGSASRGPMGMGPGQQGPMPQGGPMGPGPGPGGPSQSMMGPMGPGGPMGPNGGPHHQVATDGQLIQQQSEIFVFTTQLANEAAQAVHNGQYKSILSYHMDQPNTKKFLQKHQKCRAGQGMAGMYGNMPNMRNKMGMMTNPMGPMGMGGPSGPMSGPMGYGSGPNSANSVAQWVQQQNQNLQEQGLNMSEGDPRMMGPNNPNFSQWMDERMFDPEFGGPGGPGMNSMNLMQSKVPNENLTPEQLQRREENLASLRKIQQMFLPPEQRGQHGFPQGPGGPGQGPGPGPGPGGQGMMPGEMGMYQQNMMSKRAMMVSQQNMMSSPHAMMESRQDMMTQEQFMMSQGMSQFGPGPHPQNMQNLSPAQREWMRLQQEYIMEKRQRAQMGPNGPQMGPGPGPGPGPVPGMDPSRGMQGQPPPSYYSSIAQKQRHGSVGMASPTSPNMNGPLGSPSMASAVADPNDPMMFQGHQRKGSFSGMDSMGPMGPGMGPGGLDMMQQGSPMNPNMMGPMGNMAPHGMKNSQVSLQRAGNPEQFVPDIPPVSGSNNSTSKPPPSYAQSTKRKRDDMEELCKNLQPTPSPQHISYLNQFDGQELTITKQINTAYRDTNTSESQSNHFTQNQAVNSPMHGPGSNKGPMSNSSQTSSGPLASPGPVTVSQGSGQGPGPSPLSGANKRLSHYDPQQQQQPPPQNSSISNSPTTPTGKSSLSNITSASLANLALGVENLSNQMQQHMMQGGPFHSIQMQSQQQQQQQQQANQNPQGPQHSQPGQSQQSSTPQPTNQHPPINSTASSSSQTHSTPSVNNTYVNANLSIQQVNIQGVNHGNGTSYPSGTTSSSTMQVSQMNMEQTQMNMQQSCANNVPGGGTMTQTGSMAQTTNMTQSRSMTPSSGMQPNKLTPSSMNMPTGMKDNIPLTCPSSMPQGYSNLGPPGMHKMSPFAQSQNPINSMMNQQVPTSGRPGSPGYPPSSMGNANVQIQQKAPNTIQYLPASQSSMPPESKNVGKPDLEFMNQFSNPMMEGGGKVPTSKMQYFQGGGNPYGPGSMGPGSGPGQDSRMGPSMGMGQDPRFGGQSMPMGSDPRMDPRMGPSPMGGDPRMGPMGPTSDPRMLPTSRHDSRMGPEMVMSPDPRMGPGGMGPMNDPRMGPGAGSMMSMGPGSGPGGPMTSMRPGSRGSPFTGPIGPAVQQSMMMRRGSPDISMSGSNFSAISGMGSPDPLNPNMNSMGGNPMSALSSMSGNPMTSMSNMSNSIMSDPMGPMSGGPQGGGMGPSMPYNSPPYSGQMPSGHGSMSMQGSRMQGPGMGSMSRSGPYSRQPSPGMRMSAPGIGPGPVSPGAPGYSNAQYQQFQQQLYSQSRPRQMSPMETMMGNPGYGGPMGPGMGAGMMPNMPHPM